MKYRTDTRKIKDSDFVSLTEIIKKENKNPKFRVAFSAEMNRLALVSEVRLLRKKMKLTQREVAERARMPQSVVARVESGTHSFSIVTLQRIAAVFNKHVGLK
jgi:DNA-binding XRE family transcriptional regulator